MAGLTLDTGALIKLEGHRRDFAKKIKLAPRWLERTSDVLDLERLQDVFPDVGVELA